ncbi:MAG: DUF1799 domain-containing protein [Pseudomonadota bacterium]
MGFAPEDYEDDDYGVWPENWPAVVVFMQLRTQWRISFAGATGLDYGVLYPLLDRVTTDPDEWQQLLDDVRVLESAALDVMNKT